MAIPIGLRNPDANVVTSFCGEILRNVLLPYSRTMSDPLDVITRPTGVLKVAASGGPLAFPAAPVPAKFVVLVMVGMSRPWKLSEPKLCVQPGFCPAARMCM